MLTEHTNISNSSFCTSVYFIFSSLYQARSLMGPLALTGLPFLYCVLRLKGKVRDEPYYYYVVCFSEQGKSNGK